MRFRPEIEALSKWLWCGLIALALPGLTFPGISQAAVLADVDSVKTLEDRVKANSKDGESWIRLGDAYLETGNIKGAERAFKKAIQYTKSAESYHGLGRVYMRGDSRFARKAFPYFRQALGKDSRLVEAQMNIARTHILLNEIEAERAFRDAMAIDATYAPAYIELANWYVENDFQMYEGELSGLYEVYLQLVPNDAEALYGQALLSTEMQDYGPALKLAEALMDQYPGEGRFVVLAAQAQAAMGDFDRALDSFSIYLRMLPEDERKIYDDLSIVAKPEELKAYREIPESDREEFLEAFWRKRDLTLVSAGKARRVEHYRRVWYAQLHFSDRVQPWDRRGEIYIRYGQPEYRMQSGRPVSAPSEPVEALRERLALEYSDDVAGQITVGEFSGRGRQRPDFGNIATAVPRDAPIYPLELNLRARHWESWTYTQVGGGVEFTFTDEFMNGKFDFPPVPSGTNLSLANLSGLVRNHPEVILNEVKSQTPEHYDVPPGMEPLEFYYDLGSFRGEDGKTRVEVYYGIPPEEVHFEEVGIQTQVRVGRTMVLSDSDGETVHRTKDELQFARLEKATHKKGDFIPDIASLEVLPGKYNLAVQLADRYSGKWGIYIQELEVPGFDSSFAMSDLELAWGIFDTPQTEKFEKEGVWVIPMPTRSYTNDRGVYVYYEVYNLAKDTFGQTRYRVEYTIQQDVRRAIGLFGALSTGIKKLFAKDDPQVAVSYEQYGSEVWEPIYLELDTGEMKLGLNQIKVTVTDLVGGDEVSKKAMFQLGQRAGIVNQNPQRRGANDGFLAPSGSGQGAAQGGRGRRR